MKTAFVLLAVITVAVACNPPADNELNDEIIRLETQFKASPEDTTITRQLADVLSRSAKRSKNDSISPYRMLQAAMLTRSLPGQELESIVAFQRVGLNYPDHPVAAEAKFQEAFTWDTFVGNEEEAIAGYREFLDQFPTHPRGATAQELLILLESDDAVLEIINSWQANDSTSSPNP